MRLNPESVSLLLEKLLRELEKAVPAPVLAETDYGQAYRYHQKGLEQALLLRLARLLSTLNAATLLHFHGFLQEQCSLQRSVDEFVEDVNFLSLARLLGEQTELHNRFLSGFFEELPKSDQWKRQKAKGRNIPPRDKIRNYLAHKAAVDGNTDNATKASAMVGHFYSSFTHGYYPQVMDMLEGDGEPSFAVNGNLSTNLIKDYREDLDNYWFRATQAFVLGSKALGQHQVCDEAYKCFKNLEEKI